MLNKRTGILAILCCGWFFAICQAQTSQKPSWLTEEEKQFLVDHPTLKLAPTPHFPPFEYWDPGNDPQSNEDDVFSGVVSSYLNHFEQKLGITFELVRTETWADNLAMLKNREIDAIGLLVPWSDRDYASVSKPYITYPAVIVVKKDVKQDLSLKDLVRKKVAVPNDYTGEQFLRQNHPEIIVVEARDPSHGIQMVSNGEVYAFFGGAAAVGYVAERTGISNLRIAGESDFQYTNGFGVRSDYEIFAGIITKTLNQIPDGQKSALHAQWISEGFLQKKFYENTRFWWLLGSFSGLLLICSIGMGIWNRKQAAFIDQLELAKKRTEQARSEAEAANEAKSAFVAMISHEIRTPMNGVLGMCELLRGTHLDSKQTDYLECASGSAENLVELINDILDFSKMEAGKLELDLQPFSLQQLVREVTTLMQTQSDHKGLQLTVQQDDSLAEAYLGDGLRIRQILLNLLSNAIKFTSKGEVAVRIRNKDENPNDAPHLIEFEVEDSGIGIAADKIERVFEPFEQEEISTTRRYGGTGLGLSICRTLAEMMGGAASASSELGRGSTFRFSAKLQPTDQLPAGSTSIAATGRAEVEPLQILLAEDNPVNQKVVTGLLELRGHRIDIVTTGTDAISSIENNDYDAVLMDIEMPGMDGLTAIRELRRREKVSGKHQWVVAITGHAMSGDHERFMAAGMDGHLVKPFKPNELYATVERSAVPQGNQQSTTKRSASDRPPIDRAVALAATGGNEELAKVLYETCLEESPKIVEQAKLAIADSDFPTARRCGHSLRSGFGAVGAMEAAKACESLEFLESDNPEDYNRAIEKIEKAFSKIG